MVDATVEVRVRVLERRVGIEWHGVGNRPVQPRKRGAKFFVGVVADGDDEIIVVKDVVQGLGAVAVDAESVALGNGYGPRARGVQESFDRFGSEGEHKQWLATT